jgi:PST family polysaccharide transporter
VALLALAQMLPFAAAITSPLLACATGLFGLRVVLIKMGPEGRIATRLTRLYAAIGWPIRSTK